MILAVDIGGTNFSLALATSDGRILKRVTRSTDRSGGAQWMIERVLKEGRRLLASSPGDVTACGISFGGPVDFESQRIVSSTHVAGWDNVAIPETIQRGLGVPAIVDNDANVGALGEFTFGAGRDCRPPDLLQYRHGYWRRNHHRPGDLSRRQRQRGRTRTRARACRWPALRLRQSGVSRSPLFRHGHRAPWRRGCTQAASKGPRDPEGGGRSDYGQSGLRCRADRRRARPGTGE